MKTGDQALTLDQVTAILGTAPTSYRARVVTPEDAERGRKLFKLRVSIAEAGSDTAGLENAKGMYRVYSDHAKDSDWVLILAVSGRDTMRLIYDRREKRILFRVVHRDHLI